MGLEVEFLPSMHKATGPIASTSRKDNNNKIKQNLKENFTAIAPIALSQGNPPAAVLFSHPHCEATASLK